MSFLKNVLGAFVEITPDENDKNVVPTIITQPISVTPQINVSSTERPTIQQNSITPEELTKFEKHFSDLFENSNLPGPDYYEFTTTVELMEGIPEPAAFKSTFKILTKNGLTKEHLISTANEYIKIVDNDAKNMTSAIDEKNQSIEKLNHDITSLNDTIAKKQQMISEMTLEIVEHKKSIDNIGIQISENLNKINTKKQSYNIASQAMKNKIISDINNINQYIS